MDLTRMDMVRMGIVQDRGQQRAIENTVIKPGFHKRRIFHTLLGNCHLLEGDYATGVIRTNTSELTARYGDRQLSLARGVRYRLSNDDVSER